MKKESNKSTGNNKEILIVEDSATQAIRIKHLLENNNYKVSVALDGKKAIDWLKKHNPALVISDILMPHMNGYELCRKIKSNKSTEDIPVILLTRLFDPEEIIEGLSCGADSFITKPFNENYLLSHIEKNLTTETGSDHNKVPFSTQIFFKGKKRFIQAEQQNVIKLMLNIYEGAIHQNEQLIQAQEELGLLNERLESLVAERTADLSEEIKLNDQIADKLNESEEKFRSIIANSPDAIFLIDQEGRCIYTNKAVTELLGFTSEEMKNKIITDLAPKNGKENFLRLLKQVLSEGKVFTEIELLQKSGDFISTDLNSVLLPGGLVYGSCRDITDRKRAEEVLNQERRMLRTLIDNLPDSIYVQDKDCRRVISNKADICNIGLTNEDEVLGKTKIELFPGKIGEQDFAEDKKVIITGKPVIDLEEEFINGNGVKHWLQTTKIPLRDKDGNITGLVGIGHDITERKENMEELIKAKEKAEESDRLKTAFLHNISHEIRTPMNAIVGFSALLSESDVNLPARELYIETIVQSSNDLLSIITDIVEISNIETNLVKALKNEININQTLKSLCNRFIPKADKKSINLICETGLSDSDALIITDSAKLTQILSNLVGNALKFTDKGNVKIWYNLKGNFLEFCVSDTGIGISPEHYEKIFNRFYQVQSTLSKLYGGTGLGLSISKGYVELLGGEIWLESKPGKGTTFFFTIPYEKQVAKSMPVYEKKAQERLVFPVKKIILVAEDVESNFKLIKYFLADSNAEVLHAFDGKEAVEKYFSAGNIDLILMDIKMPVMDGYTAVKLIREKNTTIPIIAQTAYADDMEKAIECGCSGFISKPFNKKDLFKVLSEFI